MVINVAGEDAKNSLLPSGLPYLHPTSDSEGPRAWPWRVKCTLFCGDNESFVNPCRPLQNMLSYSATHHDRSWHAFCVQNYQPMIITDRTNRRVEVSKRAFWCHLFVWPFPRDISLSWHPFLMSPHSIDPVALEIFCSWQPLLLKLGAWHTFLSQQPLSGVTTVSWNLVTYPILLAIFPKSAWA